MLSISFKCPICDFEWNNSYPAALYHSETPQCFKCLHKPVWIQSFDFYPMDDSSEVEDTKKKTTKPKKEK